MVISHLPRDVFDIGTARIVLLARTSTMSNAFIDITAQLGSVTGGAGAPPAGAPPAPDMPASAGQAASPGQTMSSPGGAWWFYLPQPRQHRHMHVSTTIQTANGTQTV